MKLIAITLIAVGAGTAGVHVAQTSQESTRV